MLKFFDQFKFSDWTTELLDVLIHGKTLSVALFSANGELLFANPGIHPLFGKNPSSSFLNPNFQFFINCENTIPLIYDGYITFGDYYSISTSILGKVYKKNDQILIIGGIDAKQLVDQNVSMHCLNQEINNLQRQLIKEKFELETTLIKLNEANRALQDHINSKDKFFSIISHDLKNPFNAIIGFSELLVNGVQNYSVDTILNYSNVIHTSAKDTYTLLSNLLEWSKLQTGKLTAHPIPIFIIDLLPPVLKQCEPMSKNKNINIKLEIQSNELIFVDKEMIQTVIRNLITNAIKFTNNDGTLVIKTEKKDSFLIVSVADNGQGIDKMQIEKLFNIENKLSKTGTNGEVGSGLGLLLCKEFVDQNKGTIWVESEKTKGSVFYFTLPLASSLQ